MELFTPNSKFYSQVLDSYTSSDEYIANKRVHINNETPPVDMFDMAHSMMKNDLWKWLFGSSSLSYDIEYNLDTDGVEYIDNEGFIIEPTIAKYVNGVRALDYGPIPYYIYSKNGKEFINPEYHRLEIEGVLLPEFDFMLHEGYRYLDILYPDHPDFTEILTTNEINDEFIQASALIGYNPDVIFMDWLASEFNTDKENKDIVDKKEALKMKLRNITNHSFRRKLYGTTSGYKQFGSEIFQHISLFPVAEYLPFRPYLIEDSNIKYNNTSKDIKWFSNIHKKPDNIEDRSINKFDVLYKKLFRLVDWNNHSYDYINEYIPPAKIYATAYPTPYNTNRLYEYQNQRDDFVPLIINEDFYVGQKIQVNESDNYIAVLDKENSYQVKVVLNYSNDVLESSNCITKILIDSLNVVTVTNKVDPIYVPFKVYRGIEYTLNEAIKKGINLDLFNSAINQSNPLCNSIKELYKLIPEHFNTNFALNPIQDGTLYISAEQFLTIYKEYLNIEIDRTDEENPILLFGNTSISDDGFVHKEDIIINDEANNIFASEIVGIENGIIDLSCNHKVSSSFIEEIERINNLDIGKYGIILEYNKNNTTHKDKKVVLFGKPFYTYREPDKDNNYIISHIKFYIQAIPKNKSLNLLKKIYNDFEQLSRDKVNALEILFNSSENTPSNYFIEHFSRYKNCNNTYELLKQSINELIIKCEEGLIHPNDNYWKLVKQNALEIINNFDFNTIKQQQLQNLYEEFIKQTDIDEIIVKPTILKNNCEKIINDFNNYIYEYSLYLIGIIAIDLERGYYDLNKLDLNDIERKALNVINQIDLILDNYIPNKAFLLNPIPEDIYMNNIGEKATYSLSSTDKITNIVEIKLDSFNEFIDYSINSLQGYVESFNFGALNTASIVDNNLDVNLTSDTFIEINGNKKYIEKYKINDIEYLTLNKDIIKAVDATSNPKKFSYATNNFLELFLPDIMINNFIGNATEETYKIEIRSICTAGNNIIEFIDEESVKRLNCLSTGDQIIGKTIENDIFITNIDLNKKQITLNKNLNVTGDFVLNYLTQLNIYAKEQDNFFNYRKKLSKNKLINSGSIFNFLKNDIDISQGYINGFIDIDTYKESLVDDLTSQIQYKQFFNRQVWDLHNDNKDKINYYALTSNINAISNLFFEASAYKTYRELDEKKKEEITSPYSILRLQKDREYIMKKEVLDYFRNYLSELSRASDVVNIGVNINAFTKTDNEATIDENIDSKFTTYGWTKQTMPYYVDIGIGKLDKPFEKLNLEDNQKYDNEPKSYWNYDIYDDSIQDYELLEKQGIDLSKADRSVWYKKEFNIKNESNIPPIYNIHIPIMRVYLGEYEVQKMISFEDYLDKKFTTVQFSVIKQVFKNLIKLNENPLNIINKKFTDFNIFKNITISNTRDDKNEIDVIKNNQYVDFKYLGVWTPSSTIENGKSYINYPPIPENDKYYYYYSIIENIQLLQVLDKQDENVKDILYQAGSILLCSKEGTINKKWEVKDFIFSGLYGTKSDLEKIISPNEDGEILCDIVNSYPVSKKDEFFTSTDQNEELTLKHKLLVKLMINLGIFKGNLKNVNCFTVKQLTKMFYYVINNETKNLDPNNPDTLEEFNSIMNNIMLDVFDNEIPDEEDIHYQSFPKHFNNIYSITKDNIFWFTYTIGFFNKIVINDEETIENYLHNCSINPGQNIALIYINNQFKIIFLNENKFLFMINAEKKIKINENEYLTFIGKYGNTNGLINGIDINNIFLFEKLNSYTNIIDLKYKNLLKGSVDVKLTAIPHFTVDGYEYIDNNLSTEIKQYDLTEDKIYYDLNYDVLYSYNTINGLKTKFAIKQDNNKFFKNLLYIYGQYNKVGATVNGKFINQGVVTPITGVRFDVDSASLFDRILEIEQINIRSQYNVNLEPTLFSNYCNIKGIFKGLYISNDNKYLNISYQDNREPILTSNKLKFYSEIQKLLPVKNNQTYPYNSLTFDNAKWTLNNDIIELKSPTIQNIHITKNLSLDSDQSLFRYYKNLLVLEGELDIAQPDTISFAKNSKLGNALDNIQINDVIESIVGISSLNSKTYQQYYTNPLLINGIKFIDYKKGIFVIVTDSEIAFKSVKSLQNLGVVNGEKIEISLLSTNIHFFNNKIINQNYTKVNSFTWDDPNNRWIISLSNEKQSDFYSIDIIDNGTTINCNLLAIYNNYGKDINTYDFINIRDDDLIDDRFAQYKTVLAKDVAFQHVDVNEHIESDIFLADRWTSQNEISIINIDAISEIEENFNYTGLRIIGSAGVAVSDEIIIEDNQDYKTLNFIIRKIENDNNTISIGTESIDDQENIKEIWIFDKEIQRWVVTTSTKDFYNFLWNYNGKDYTNVKTYIINKNMDLLGGIEQYLWKLPRPEVSENIIVAALVVNKKFKLKISIYGEENSIFELYNITLSNHEKIIIDQQNRPVNSLEGPYLPEFNNFTEEKLKSTKWNVYNNKGNQALILGSTLFIYTPTKAYDIIPQDNTYDSLYNNTSTTVLNHWKKAELPSIINNNYQLFNTMSFIDVYRFVDRQRTLVLEQLKLQQENFPENLAIKTVYDFINSHIIQFYEDEESIPIEIKVNGLYIHQTPFGKIPEFIQYVDKDERTFTKWRSSQEARFELGNTVFVYLTTQNYLRYLLDYYEIILGAKRNDYYFEPESIKDVTLTDTQLVIRNKYDDIITLPLDKAMSRNDIENYNNWNVSSLSSDYLFNSETIYESRTICVNGNYINIDTYPISNPIKSYTILEKYIKDNIQIYVGFIEAKSGSEIENIYNLLSNDNLSQEEINSFINLFPNNINNLSSENRASIIFDKKYPIIFSSIDNGLSFTKQILPGDGIILPRIDQYFSLEENINANREDIWAEAIYRQGNKIYVHFKNENENIGKTSFTIIEQEENNILVFDNENIEYNEYFLAKTWNNFTLGSLNGVFLQNEYFDNLLYSPTYSNQFALEQQYFIDFNDQRVTNKTFNSISFNNMPIPAESSEILKVLVAINTTNMIENQTQYLEYKDSYLDSFGQFVVPTYIAVEDISQANRMYSSRECMTLSDREIRPIKGIPSILEDGDHSIYQYYDPILDINGNQIINYIEARNIDNQIIYLCQENGDYLLYKDSDSITNYFTLKDMILANVDYTTLVPAPLLSPNYIAEETDDLFEEFINIFDDKKIYHLELNGKNPQFLMFILKIDEIITALKEGNEFISRKFYHWPMENGIPLSAEEIESRRNIDNTFSGEWVINNPEFFEAVTRIEEYEGPFGTIFGKPLDSRFDYWPKEFGLTNYFVFDKSINTVLLKENDNFYMNISMPYEFLNGQVIYNNMTFISENSILLPYDQSQELNGVYLKSKGYGGSLLNENFDLERPEQIDYQAFYRKLAINNFKEYIFLNDQYGNRLNIKNGLFRLLPSENSIINYHNIAKKENNIKFYLTDEDYENNNFISLNVFKLEQAKIEIFTPKKIIWFNSYNIRDNNNNEILFENKNQILLSILKIHKAGINVDKQIIKDFYKIEFKDKYENIIENIRYDIDNQQLIYLYTGNILNNIPTIDGDILCIHITDENNQKIIYELNVATKEEKEKAKIISINNVDFNNEELLNKNIVNIIFDGRTIEEEDYFISTDSNSYQLVKSITDNGVIKDFETNILINSYEETNVSLMINSIFPFNIDVRNLNLELLLDKYWYKNNINEIRYELYSKDQKYIQNSQPIIEEREGKFYFVVNINNISFEKNISIKEHKLQDITIDKYIYTIQPNEIDFKFTYNNSIIVDGLYGNAIFNLPRYLNFKDLLEKKENIIEYENRRIISTYNGEVINEILEISPTYTNLTLKNLVNYDLIDLNTGSGFFLKFKILPMNTIYPQVKYLNDPNYISEVSILDTKLYGFDRVWINKEAYVPVPMTINNIIYNEESLPLYYNNNWLNKDGFMIYLSDKNGKFTRPVIRNGKIEYDILGNEFGDCREQIYSTIDPRHNPYEPMYKSSIEWFKSEFYIEGKEINPFLININIKDKYDEKLRDFIQDVTLTKPVKYGNTFIQEEVSDSYLTLINNSLQWKYDITTDSLIKKSKLDFIDYVNGTINMIIQGPADFYQNEEYQFLYGIKYTNTFYRNGKYSSIWNLKTQLDNKIDLSFYLNTKENLLDKQDRDTAVVDITEMGLFNKKGELVAYMTHPIAQYNTKDQHLSYNLLIEEV